MKARWAVASAIGGAIVAVVAVRNPPATATAIAPPPAGSNGAGVAAARPPTAVVDLRAEVRDTIRAELGALAVRPAPVPDETSAAPTAEQAGAEQAAMMVVSSAIDAGRWTRVENDQLWAALDRMHPTARDQVMQAWATAVNDQRLALDPSLSF